MHIITYTKKNLIGKTILGCALIALGVITMTENIIFGFIFLALGINFVATEGSEIDITSKTYRSIWSVFGIKFGKWKNCPEFEYVSVFKTKKARR
ncbi:hypothetical protein [Flavobacterium sp. NRK1]|uniref:hypothetical protein n=1 Tax=Flavobacterium sp. NRK1 TaxID=2954929 RepID=UPI0020931B81|nr:hypothetical protein [Flavobacterium sp. NRK1]MCO6148714.1 hypothetical protein [Flavobacterium sp. NRK1]